MDLTALANSIQWWHWVVLGIVLMISELFIPTFFIFWFGISAVITGLIAALLPLAFAVQLLCWAILSVILVFAWFRFFKQPDRTKSGLSREAFIGQRGMIIKDVSEMSKGEIRFQHPILGSDRWPVISDDTIKTGDKAVITDIIGQMLKVSRSQ